MNAVEEDGFAALHVSCQSGHTEAVRRLLAAGAEVNLPARSSSWMPLHYAAQDGFVDVGRCLLEHGRADAQLTTAEGYTPLHVAAENGHVETVSNVQLREYHRCTGWPQKSKPISVVVVKSR